MGVDRWGGLLADRDTDSREAQPSFPVRHDLPTMVKVILRRRCQPDLLKVLQDQDATTRITVTIDVASAGIAEEALDNRVIEGLDQLGIDVTWEPS